MNQNPRPRLLSGIKPTGELHIGNYFGAMKQQVGLFQKGTYDCLIMVADYHALNLIQDAPEMHQRILELAAGYMAVGLDPEQLTLFKQSSVPAHTELTWIFDTITTMPYLMRAHAFKDAEAKGKEISVGTFNYPMLMAADILLYDAAVVPVGQDQKQHVEYARDTAEKFNRTFSETFALPEPYILESVATVPGIDGRKMSKSYGNTVPLFADRATITDRVMSIVTDSAGERPENVYAIHRLLKSEAELAPLYEEHAGKYKALKEALIEDLEIFIAPMRSRFQELMSAPETIEQALVKGGEAANAIANEKMQRARRAIGVEK
jgi:tryptophanyl-tRNA synthetase